MSHRLINVIMYHLYTLIVVSKRNDFFRFLEMLQTSAVGEYLKFLNTADK